MHLLIPFACTSSPACEAALRTLPLPHLERLLGQLQRVDSDTGLDSSLSPPHERVLARQYGLPAPDGQIAWAAREARASGLDGERGAWAWVTPVHWTVGSNHILMREPRELVLQEAESHALLATMQPYFEEDGITLHYAAPQRWLAQSVLFKAMPAASLDRVAGRDISAWMPSSPKLRRLQNEMQMLLYTHPVNDARLAAGQLPVNSFWPSGTGSLPANAGPDFPQDLVIDTRLRDAALADDWANWTAQWQQLDQDACRKLLEQLTDGGQPVQLTLCGSRSALHFQSVQRGLVGRLQHRWRRTPLHTLFEQL